MGPRVPVSREASGWELVLERQAAAGGRSVGALMQQESELGGHGVPFSIPAVLAEPRGPQRSPKCFHFPSLLSTHWESSTFSASLFTCMLPLSNSYP